jgi:hypothetical protein
LPRKNARVANSRITRAALATGLLLLALSVGGCTTPAQQTADKIGTRADEVCKEGNKAACHTIVQVIGPSKIAIESTLTVDGLADGCKNGKHGACEQLAVMHAELSSWCSSGNTRACAEVASAAWPHGWDEPALIDAARVSCMKGTYKKDSNTCRALDEL